ncbi:inositol monophosphatase family protein [Photobacterium minamisatsumaniensis]|uniref:inositol monophosphatase family protein n=1 Tax=Photobacterium minamisatsumaniensis TaxID=2910233 RepID=UPI003D10899E
MLNNAILNELIQIVHDVAQAEITPHFRNLDTNAIAAKDFHSDLVTIADQNAEARISEKVRELLPDALIIGEEAVSENPQLLEKLNSAELAVIIDPVDGTWNFANHLPVFGVILAVVINGETQFGLLYDPIADDWVQAERGKGAYYQRPDGFSQRLTINAETELDKMTGCLSLSMFEHSHRQHVASQTVHFERIMALGCSCFEYRLLATSSFSFVLTSSLKPWDHAAGQLVHQEAGGYSALLDGQEYKPTLSHGNLLLAPDKQTWEKLQTTFSPYEPK